MQTWQDYINMIVESFGESPDDIVSSTLLPEHLETGAVFGLNEMGEPKMGEPTVWTKEYAYLFLWDEGVYTPKRVARDPGKLMPKVPDNEVLVRVIVQEVYNNTYEFTVPRRKAKESSKVFIARCKRAAALRIENHECADSMDHEFSHHLSPEQWEVQIQS